MSGRDPWGGALEIAADEEDRSRNNLQQDYDKAALDETQQSWLLGPGEQKKKEYVDLGCLIVSKKVFKWSLGCILAAGLLTVIITLILKFAPRHHNDHAPPDNYTLALRKAC
ncbi:hypothetical protein LIER_43815 [Lithospermum erythrorhizon]|uniref:Cellulase n=1 Tax=Lithospermum erythrorhizon TaxID=34254 RepID=A0AAV3R038_LITER